jgi:alanine-alpha-ketoisovalerate/valine-pyruvate aminotransferase
VFVFCRASGATVLAGTTDPAATAASDPKAQFSTVTQMHYHPDFRRNTMENDIAMLHISPAFNTTGIIKYFITPDTRFIM